MDRLISTLIRIVVAVGVSGVLFVALNYFFSQATKRWKLFNTVAGAFFGLIYFGILDGNRLMSDVGPTLIFWPIVGAVVGGIALGVLSELERPKWRKRIALGIMTAIGIIQAAGWRSDYLPNLDWSTALAWTFATGVLFGAIGLGVRRNSKSARKWGLVGLAIGWMLGAWGGADFGANSRWDAYLASIIGFAMLGRLLGISKIPDDTGRIKINAGSRKYIFLAPALAFVSLGLLIPLIRTIYLSLLTRREGGRFNDLAWNGLENYGFIFTNENSLDLSGWTNFFTSRLVWWGAGLIVLALVIWLAQIFRSEDRRPRLSGGSISPFMIGWFLLATAVFATLRGTVVNNLWWVFFVTVMSSVLGLTIAVLADRARLESMAKSLIFMPMAISFVGASIIWRYMYIARPPTKPQTGLFNSIWVGLGQLSYTDSWTGILAAAVFIGIIAFLVMLGLMSWRTQANKMAISSFILAALFGYLLYRLLGPGLGGIATTGAGEKVPDTIIFLQNIPFNNIWLMIILVWIQTGFAMVIFSAAIKAVPTEFIEAAKVDGATETQIFWRITIPQIATTVGVVITTMIVTVMKVYDIVKVMTNGNFDTQVLASDMWQRAFTELNYGLGSALAVVLFISVIPIMFYNIRRMQKIAA